MYFHDYISGKSSLTEEWEPGLCPGLCGPRPGSQAGVESPWGPLQGQGEVEPVHSRLSSHPEPPQVRLHADSQFSFRGAPAEAMISDPLQHLGLCRLLSKGYKLLPFRNRQGKSQGQER